MVNVVLGQVAAVDACLPLGEGTLSGLALFFQTMTMVLLDDVSLWTYIKVGESSPRLEKRYV